MSPDPDEIILNLQSLYRGWFVRKFLKTCFSEFCQFSEEIGDHLGLKHTGLITSFWEQGSYSIQDNLNKSSADSCANEEVAIDSSEKITNDHLVHSSPCKFDGKISSDTNSKTTIVSEELKGKLFSLNQEKLWLENAIMARIEYLTNF